MLAKTRLRHQRTFGSPPQLYDKSGRSKMGTARRMLPRFGGLAPVLETSAGTVFSLR